jgi:alpha-glucoside transport system substrate-binding protein
VSDTRRRARYVAVAAAAAAGSLLLGGCLSSNGKTAGTQGANSNTGKNITMIVAFSGSQFTDFKASLMPYAKSQGINLTLTSDSNFNTDIVNKVNSGNEPDIAMFPQPGILLQLAKQGKVADLDNILDVSKLKSEMVTGLLNYGTMNGKLYGAPPSINVKSLVFYPKIAWAKAGLKPPTTLSQLLSFSAQLKSQGKTPWCMGIESGSATGWPATDWLEQLVLDYGGVNQYNGWIKHTVKFSSPLVTKAANTYQKFFSTPGWVAGGQKAIASNNFATAGNPMFNANNTESSPGCWMYKQGSFVVAPGDFPTPVLNNQDKYLGVFRFPGTSASSKPVEGGGDLAALFSGKNQYAVKIMKYMLSPTFGKYAAEHDNLISPFKSFNMSNYPSALYRSMAQIAYSATQFAFDASDQMPQAVGTGSFWQEMTKFVAGQESASSMLKNIDNSWPTS